MKGKLLILAGAALVWAPAAGAGVVDLDRGLAACAEAGAQRERPEASAPRLERDEAAHRRAPGRTVDIGADGANYYQLFVGSDGRGDIGTSPHARLSVPAGIGGTGNIVVLVPAVTGGGPDSFVYLYPSFSDSRSAGGGFEDWRARKHVPLPSAGIAGLLTLGGLVLARYRRMRS